MKPMLEQSHELEPPEGSEDGFRINEEEDEEADAPERTQTAKEIDDETRREWRMFSKDMYDALQTQRFMSYYCAATRAQAPGNTLYNLCEKHNPPFQLNGTLPFDKFLYEVSDYATDPSTVFGLVETCRLILGNVAQAEGHENLIRQAAADILLRKLEANDGRLPFESSIIGPYPLTLLLDDMLITLDPSQKRKLARAVYLRGDDDPMIEDPDSWRERYEKLTKQALREANLASNISMPGEEAAELLRDACAFSWQWRLKLSRQERYTFENLPFCMTDLPFQKLYEQFFVNTRPRQFLPKNLFEAMWIAFRKADAFRLTKDTETANNNREAAANHSGMMLHEVIRRARNARVPVPKDILEQCRRLDEIAGPYHRGLSRAEVDYTPTQSSISRVAEMDSDEPAAQDQANTEPESESDR